MRKPDQASTDAGDERDDKVDAAIVNANPVGAIAKLPNKPESDAAVVVSSTKDVPDSMHPPLPTKSDTIAVAFLSDADFRQHRQTAEAAIQTDVATKLSFHKTLTAYIEPPLRDIVPGTGDRGNFKVDKDAGRPPKFVIPLPRRTHTPKDLRMIQYAKVQTCHDMPGKFPVDRGLEIDENGGVVVWNVGNTPTPPDFPQQEAPYCPVELDPFLPWIHDVFPSPDGTKIEFIAQNKRRCRTGIAYTENVNRLVPQVTLLQSVSVERVSESQARRLAPDLWHPDRDLAAAGTTTTTASPSRYRLAPYAEASTDGGMYTRFICRFHVTTVAEGIPVTVPLGETLSEYPFNYELVSYRKQQRSLLTAKGKDTTLFWTSNLHFQCPLPANNDALRHAVATGMTVLTDGTPTVYVDLVPIRTSARYAELHLTEDMIGPRNIWDYPAFDAKTRWGPDYVLPRVEASGRWANIPICLPPALVNEEIIKTVTDVDTFEKIEVSRKLVPNIAELTQKPHFLSACLWASTEFKTRGLRKGGSTDTLDRLQEWIEFHLMVGFDHIYVYDNSGAHTNETTLEPVIDLFPGKVTRIDWPAIVCNNNIPAHDSTGERSSQYAAENSCRTYVPVLVGTTSSNLSLSLTNAHFLVPSYSRYGPFTEWMAAFDTDEYFVPMGDYTSLKDVLVDVAKTGTNILSLRSSRGRLRMDKSNVVSNGKAIEKSADFTYLEAYK